MFSDFFTNFHFLRPFWLLAIIPIIGITYLLLQKKYSKNNWQKVIAPHLLPHLLHKEPAIETKWPIYTILTAWLVACLALSGPSWHKNEVTIKKDVTPLIIVLDLSYNMLATDMTPNRLGRVRFKLQDMFDQRQEGLTALVVYSGSAHVVAPLTDDRKTLSHLIRSLSPDIMPELGNNPGDGILSAINLLEQGSGKSGTILLITDNLTENQQKRITSLLKKTPHTLSILGVGTPQGSPIPLPTGGFLKNANNGIIISKLNATELGTLTKKLGGKYHTITLDSSDINALLPSSKNQMEESKSYNHQHTQWKDSGYWLIFLLLPIILGCFRRNWLVLILLTLFIQLPEHSYALSDFNADTLWYNANQLGFKALNDGDSEKAAQLFKENLWKAEALYRSGKFQEAEELYKKDKSPNSLYNLANSLAQQGKLQQAIDTYDQVLEQIPNMQDAIDNRAIIKKLLDQQKQDKNQKDKEQNKDNQQDKNQQDKEQNKDNKQDNNQQNQEQNDKDQQNQEQKDKEQNRDNNQDQSQNNQDQENKNQQNKDNPQDPNKDKNQGQGQGQDQENQDKESKQDQKQENQQENQQENDREGTKNKQQPQDANSEEEQKRHSQKNNGQKDHNEEEKKNISSSSEDNKIDKPTTPANPNQKFSNKDTWELNSLEDNPGNLFRQKFKQQIQERNSLRNQEYREQRR